MFFECDVIYIYVCIFNEEQIGSYIVPADMILYWTDHWHLPQFIVYNLNWWIIDFEDQ